MFRFLIFSILVLLPQTVTAEDCRGQNLIEQMPPGEREALMARAEDVPFGRGLLWRAELEGRVITLFGSFHLPHSQTRAHEQRIMPLADAAEITFFEMNAEDVARFESDMQTAPDLMFVDHGDATLPTLLSETEWKDLSGKMQARGFPPFMAAKMKPMFASMMLGLSPCKLRQMQQGRTGIDRSLAERLANENMPSRSIEHYRTALELLDAYPAEKQIEMLRLSLLQDIDAEDMTETLYRAYIDEEIALIWEYTRRLSLETGSADAAEDFALFEKLLLTDRNKTWMDELRTAKAQRILVVVGAAHLMGETGLLNLLEADGYTVTRLSMTP